MPGRANWYDQYWDNLDDEAVRRLRTRCPRCGSTKTYYNQQYNTWRCGRCEHSFRVRGMKSKRPWWKRLFGRG